MNPLEKIIRTEAKNNNLDADDLGNLTIAILREEMDDPIGGLIYRQQIEEDSEKLQEVAKHLAEYIEAEGKRQKEEIENEARNKEEN